MRSVGISGASAPYVSYGASWSVTARVARVLSFECALSIVRPAIKRALWLWSQRLVWSGSRCHSVRRILSKSYICTMSPFFVFSN